MITFLIGVAGERNIKFAPCALPRITHTENAWLNSKSVLIVQVSTKLYYLPALSRKKLLIVRDPRDLAVAVSIVNVGSGTRDQRRPQKISIIPQSKQLCVS